MRLRSNAPSSCGVFADIYNNKVVAALQIVCNCFYNHHATRVLWNMNHAECSLLPFSYNSAFVHIAVLPSFVETFHHSPPASKTRTGVSEGMRPIIRADVPPFSRRLQ